MLELLHRSNSSDLVNPLLTAFLSFPLSYEYSAVQDFTVTDLTLVKSQATASQYINGQCYLMIISCLLLLVAFSARQQPFTYKEGKHVYLTR